MIKRSHKLHNVPAKISTTELRGYEEIIPPYTVRPKIVNSSYDSTQKYEFIIFDTETTCTREAGRDMPTVCSK